MRLLFRIYWLRFKIMLATIFSPQHCRAVQLIASSFAINTLMLAMPIMTLQVYDRVMTNKNSGTLVMLSMAIVGAVAIETTLRAARSYIFTLCAASFEYSQMNKMLGAIVYARPASTRSKDIGEYIQALSALARMKDYAGERLITLAVDLPYVGLFMGLLVFLGGTLAIIPFLLTVAFAATAWHFGARLQRAIQERNQADEQRYGAILETLSGIHTIKGMGIEPRFYRRYEQAQSHAGRVNFRIAALNHILSSTGAMFSQAIIIAVVAAGAPLVLSGHITMGALIACVLLSGRLIQPLQAALSLWIGYQEFQQAETRVRTMQALPQRHIHVSETPTKREGMIECRDLAFGFDPLAPFTLSKINMTILPGEMLALRGPNGSGRSTFQRLLAGIYEPTQGKILIDGIEPHALPSNALLEHVAYLSSEAVLFRGSVLDNLTGFHPDFEDQAKEIAALLGIDKLVSVLPMGYDTYLDGSPNEVIPPGFRQRIAIARALLHKPKVILFDKADRSLDREGYNHLFRLLARLKGKATIIMVSDDNNIIRLADRECILTRGSIIETPRQYSPRLVSLPTFNKDMLNHGIHA